MNNSSDRIRAQIEAATHRLAKLKAQELLSQHRANHHARINDRKADAKRKIELGGLFVATHTSSLDKAELAGALLSYLAARQQQGNVLSERMRSQGAAHLAQREAARAAAKSGGR